MKRQLYYHSDISLSMKTQKKIDRQIDRTKKKLSRVNVLNLKLQNLRHYDSCNNY